MREAGNSGCPDITCCHEAPSRTDSRQPGELQQIRACAWSWSRKGRRMTTETTYDRLNQLTDSPTDRGAFRLNKGSYVFASYAKRSETNRFQPV